MWDTLKTLPETEKETNGKKHHLKVSPSEIFKRMNVYSI